jgi:hypothetical protein
LNDWSDEGQPLQAVTRVCLAGGEHIAIPA